MDITKKFDRSVTMLCWAYNEEENIADFLKKALTLLEKSVIDYEIVLVDDCSNDNTYRIAREFELKYPQIKIVRHDQNKNVGMAFRSGISKAEKEFLFWQTIDWSYDLGNLREKLENLKRYDILVGTRRKAVIEADPTLRSIKGLVRLFKIKHITRRSDTVGKAMISLINYLMIRILFNFELSDFQNICFYRTQWIKTINPEARGPFLTAEYLYKSYWSGKSIKEVEINFVPRKKGKAKGAGFKVLVKATADILRLWFKWVVFRCFKYEKRGKIQRLYEA